MGMESPELLLLVENCPRGAETLVTRVIHILTDKGECSSGVNLLSPEPKRKILFIFSDSYCNTEVVQMILGNLWCDVCSDGSRSYVNCFNCIFIDGVHIH